MAKNEKVEVSSKHNGSIRWLFMCWWLAPELAHRLINFASVSSTLLGPMDKLKLRSLFYLTGHSLLISPLKYMG